MPQYDGSIRINTEIQTKQAQHQLDALENRIVKSADKIDSLRSKLDLSKNIKLPTQEYTEIQNQIEATEKKIVDLTSKQEKFLSTGGKVSSSAYKRMQYDVDELRQSLSYLKGEEQDLIATGKAFTIGNPEQAAALEQQIKSEESSLDLMLEKRDILQSKIQAQAEEEQRLAEIKENATVSDQKLVDLLEQRRQLLEQIKDLEKAGVTEGYQEYDTALADLSDIQNQINGIRDMRDAVAEARNSYVGLGESVRNAFATMGRGFIDIPIATIKAGVNGLVSAFQRLGTVAKNVAIKSFRLLGTSIKSALSKAGSMIGNMVSKLKTLGSTAKKSFSGMEKSVKKSNNAIGLSLKNILKYGFGIRSIYVLVNKIRSAIKEGFGNLYKDNERFQNSVDELKASILTLKNAFAAAFRPLVDIAIPYIQMAADKMTELLNKVGQFTAAITGQKTYTKVIKQTADAFKDAKKAAEGYLSPLDEINKYSTGKGEDEEDQFGQMFEEVPIEQKFKDIAEKVNNVFKDLFSPIKEAWNREGEFVIDSWKYGLGEVKKLLADIGRDFLEVWKQPATVAMLEDILHIFGDIGLIVGNLAAKFREAWNENKVGLHILENIRDIFAGIIHNIREAADYTVEWTKSLDFSPLLSSIQGWTESLIRVFDNLSGIIVDFYENVLLPLGKWTIESGIPDFIQVLTDFNNNVEWESLRSRLAEFWKHLEPFAEVVGEGLIIFISRLTEALAGFINGHLLSDFLTMIENWMSRVKPEDVANAFEKIATAIITLKSASLLLPIITGAFSVFSTGLTAIKGVVSLLTAAISGLGSVISFLVSPIGIVIAAVAALAAGFVYLYKTNEDFKQSVDTLYNDHIKPFFESVTEGISQLLDKFKEFWDDYVKPMLKEWGEKFVELWEEHVQPALSKMFDALTKLWEEALQPLIGWIIDTLLPILLPIIDEVFDTTMDLIGGLFDLIGDLSDIISECVDLIVDLLKGDWSGAWEHAKNIVETVWNSITGIIKGAVDKITGWIEKLLSLFDKAKSNGSFSSGDSGQTYSSRTFSARMLQTSYIPAPIAQTLRNADIPGYATGQVIPTSMKKHLAWLGDNNHETEVVSPLSTIEQAVENVMARINASGVASGKELTIKVPIYLDGKVIYEAVINQGKINQMAGGTNDFLLGTT